MAGEIGTVFAGIGLLMILSVISYFVYQFARSIKQSADLEGRYNLFEILCIEKKAKEKGFDLVKEELKRSLMEKQGKNSIREQLKREIIAEYFEKKEAKE